MRAFGLILLALALALLPLAKTIAGDAVPPLPPIDFTRLLAPPTPAEIREAHDRIIARNVHPDSVEVVAVRRFPIDNRMFEARFIRHRIDGVGHCGIALVPEGAAPGSLAGAMDVPGVRWDFPTRSISQLESYAVPMLGPHLADFVILEPCLRGAAVEAVGLRLEAEGDPRDAWDGAATDIVAFAHAAAEVVPEMDFRRLVVFGGSRGGAVALLAAQRSPIFRAAVSFAGPTDFFREMNRPGNWAEALRASYAARRPATYENQQLEFFVDGRERLPLAALRARIIGSSPLHFAEHLPPTQVHQGRDDPHVPVGNAARIRDAFRRAFPGRSDRQVFIHDGQGHSLRESPAMMQARAFLWDAVRPRRASP